jgi:branched-subunit amino acid aminotransferase/4-amino-4-deoxychorismate lyase
MPAPLAFLNGRFVPAAELTLGFADAGFVFGATATDFCRTYRGRLFRWPDHLARLRRDCGALHIPLPYDDAELTAAAERLAAEHAGESAVVTLATPGPLGYLLGTRDDGPPTVGMHSFPLPLQRYRRFFTDGVTLAVAGEVPGGIVPAAVKHRSRLHWWLARTVGDSEAVPALLDRDGVADTAIGNVLAVVGGTVVRPEPGSALEGVSVAVIAELCEKLGLPFAEGRIDLREPGGVTELLLAGSGFGVAGVRRVVTPAGENEFAWPGPVLKWLLAAWSQLVGVDVEAEMLGEVT